MTRQHNEYAPSHRVICSPQSSNKDLKYLQKAFRRQQRAEMKEDQANAASVSEERGPCKQTVKIEVTRCQESAKP